jgi:hypothetical protein
MSKRMNMVRKAMTVCLFMLFAAGCSSVPTRPTAAAEPAAAASTAAPARELTDATCAQYLDLVEQVKLESQAADATAPQDAQDDLVSVMLWLHGYLSGRNGIDNQARPLTRDWLASNVGVLARACAVDEKRRVIDVVAGIQ